jgi:Low iron-inducible periplasmic protein
VTLGTAGKVDFSGYNISLGGRSEAAKKGIQYMIYPMQVIAELEYAYASCSSCSSTTCGAIYHLDEAVAYYTGSLEGVDGAGSGVVLYNLGDARCANFKTCGPSGDATSGTSKVNLDIFAAFNSMRTALNGNCPGALAQKNIISKKIFIPIIQGALRYAYITDTQTSFTEAAETEGYTFSASVIPLIHSCNSVSANTIMTNMKLGQKNTASSVAVKAAFESNYLCLGITCADVGGLYSATTSSYSPGMAPCLF